jgi:hypothetical protein
VTGAALVKGSLEMIGAWSPMDGDPSAADMERGIFHANLMRKSWNARNIVLHTIERQSLVWPSSTVSATIGQVGADLSGTRPLAVLFAKMVPAGQTYEVPVKVLAHEEYAAIADKAQAGEYAIGLLYEPSGPAIGTISLWPVPLGSPTLILHNKALLTDITAEQEVIAPEAYEAALVSQLAKRLAVAFGKPWTQAMEDIAVEDLATVKSANVRVPPEAPMPGGFPGSRSTAMTRSRFHGGAV